MTYVEAPTKTLERFVPTWRNTSPDRLEQEIISTFNETHRRPDEYKFKYKNGKIVDFLTETEIKIDTSTYLGKKDAELLGILTSWVSQNKSGTAIWISPSYESAYPCNKITTYHLETDENDVKSTFNTTVLFDSSKEDTLAIATRISSTAMGIKDPEDLRNKIFVVDDFDLADLLELVGISTYHSPLPKITIVRQFVDLIRSGADPFYIAQRMNEEGIVGKFSVSCAGGNTLRSLESNSLTLNVSGSKDRFGSLEFKCPHCGATNSRPFGRLIGNCQHCGGDVRC